MDKKVLLLLAQGFEAYEASVFTDVFGWSQVVGDVSLGVVTAARRPVIQCKWNFRVLPEIRVSEVDVTEYDALAIPGGFKRAGFYEDAYNEDFLNLIRQFHESKKPIAAVCTAVLVLGISFFRVPRSGTLHRIAKRLYNLKMPCRSGE